MKASATELNKQPGKFLNFAQREPVVVTKSGEPVAVMVSYEHYTRLEDAYWGQQAEMAESEKSLGKKASLAFLLGDD